MTVMASKHIPSSTNECTFLLSSLKGVEIEDNNILSSNDDEKMNNSSEEQSYLLQKERFEILTKLQSILKESMISINRNKDVDEEYKDVNTLKTENEALHSTNETISYSMKRLIICIDHLLSHDSTHLTHLQTDKSNENIALLDTENDDGSNDISIKLYEIRESLISACNEHTKIELKSSNNINDLRAENQLLRNRNKNLNYNIGELVTSLDELLLQQNDLLARSNGSTNVTIETIQVKYQMKLNLNDIKQTINTASSSNLPPTNNFNIIQLENKSLRYTNDKLMQSINNLINSAEELLQSSAPSNRFFRRWNRQKLLEKDKMLETLQNMRESLKLSFSCALNNVVGRDNMDLVNSENELLKDVNHRLTHTIKHLVTCVEQLMQT